MDERETSIYKCKRPACNNPPQHRGYCMDLTVGYCRDMHEVEQDRDAALAEVEHLRAGISAYRSLVGRVEKNGEVAYYLQLAKGDGVTAWEREDRQR